jgi:micrococcal nuclease
MARSSKARSRRRLILTASLVLLVALLIVSFRLVEEIGFDRAPGDRFVIVKVIDGDTVELAGGDRLRLSAIDTPERNQPLYDEAKELLSRLTLGKPATIKYGSVRRDRYGRLLGFLYVDSLFINKEILENGLGYLYLFKDTPLNSPQVKALLAAQREAIADGSGLFGMDREPESEYIALHGSFRFHRPNCRSVANRRPGAFRTFSTREEALYEGLAPCRNCRP